MSAHEFVFALELSGDAPGDQMLGDVAGAVLAHVGCSAATVKELAAAVGEALAERAAGGAARCDVRFNAHAGAIEIVVSCAGHDQWRTMRRLA